MHPKNCGRANAMHFQLRRENANVFVHSQKRMKMFLYNPMFLYWHTPKNFCTLPKANENVCYALQLLRKLEVNRKQLVEKFTHQVMMICKQSGAVCK